MKRTWVALVLDGKTFAEDRMVIALGITLTGEKVLLGRHGERRGLRRCPPGAGGAGPQDGPRPLCVLDGAKGLRKAIQTVIHRCQWHQREHVLAYLPTRQRASVRRKLQAAYEQPAYAEATVALLQNRQELRLVNDSAVKSLEETLTLHRLGVVEVLGISLKTTTCLESLTALLEQRTDKVDRWRTSDQTQRWLAAALLEIEPRLRRITRFLALPMLRQALSLQ